MYFYDMNVLDAVIRLGNDDIRNHSHIFRLKASLRHSHRYGNAVFTHVGYTIGVTLGDHKALDLGFGQKQSVAILYAVSVVLGLAAVIFTTSGEMKIAILAVAILLCFFFAMNIKVSHKKQEEQKAPDEEQK